MARLLPLLVALFLPVQAAAFPWERDRNFDARVLGGLLVFPGDAGDLATAGPSWGAAFGWHPFGPLGFEIAYQGATWQTDGSLEGPQQRAMEHGGQLHAVGRLEFGRFRPYALAGVGLAHLDLDAGEAPLDDGLLVKLPLGLGFDFAFPVGRAPIVGPVGPAVLVGARASWELLLGNDPFTEGGALSGRDADRLVVQASAGLAF